MLAIGTTATVILTAAPTSTPAALWLNVTEYSNNYSKLAVIGRAAASSAVTAKPAHNSAKTMVVSVASRSMPGRMEEVADEAARLASALVLHARRRRSKSVRWPILSEYTFEVMADNFVAQSCTRLWEIAHCPLSKPSYFHARTSPNLFSLYYRRSPDMA